MNADRLRALADRIDHEELWRRPALEHGKMTQEQRDRMNAAVELRRWADRKKPGRWIIVPPDGPTQFSAQSLDGAVEMAKRDEMRRKVRDAQ